MLPYIINEAQFAFISSRDISNNITMVHEICLELLPSSYSNIFLAKLDIKKTFDIMNFQALFHHMSVKVCPLTFIK